MNHWRDNLIKLYPNEVHVCMYVERENEYKCMTK